MRGLPKLTVVVVLLLFVSGAVWAQVSPAFLSLPQQSVATTDDALSTLVNPAGLGVENGGSFYLLTPYRQGGGFNDWGLALGGEGIGFTFEGIRESYNANSYTLGMGGGDKGFYLGAAYSWTRNLDRQNNWDLGMLVRPFRFISLGAVARGINRPRVDDQKPYVGYDLGLALRPTAIFGPLGRRSDNRLTLTADVYLRKFDETLTDSAEDYFDEVAFKFGAAVEVVHGIVGHIDYYPEVEGIQEQDEMIYGGLTLSFGNLEIGGYHCQDSRRGVAWIKSGDLYKPTVLKRPVRRFVEIKLSGPIIEYQRGFSFFRPRHRTVYKFHRQLEKYAADPEVSGVLIRLGGLSAGWAKRQEIRNALTEFKASGKKVVVYMESGGNGDYYLASVADRIYLNPAGDLFLTGLAAHTLFLKGTLDKIGVDPELDHIGKYKSASEMLTEEDMSDAQREATEYILDDFYQELVSCIAEGRDLSEDRVRELVDDGPYTSSDAFAAGLVDSLVYEDQLKDLIKELAEDKPKASVIAECKFDRRRKDLGEWDDMRRKTVAIVYGVGSITSGESSEGGLFGGESMGSETIAEAIRSARENKDVVAIIFRVDSPGGSGLASDVILREVKRCTEEDGRKPIIVSMSDVAGSGGYFVACQADTIIALPTTITGSIGVISGKLAYHRFQQKIGVNTATITRGRFADMWAGWRSFTDEEWEKMRDQLNQFYQLFLERVAEGRDMDTSAVNEVAQGRIWTGSQARDRGLVDLTGGLDLALELAARAGDIKEGEAFDVRMYPRRKDFGLAYEFESIVLGAIPEPIRELTSSLTEQTRWEDGEPLFLMPYELKIE